MIILLLVMQGKTKERKSEDNLDETTEDKSTHVHNETYKGKQAQTSFLNVVMKSGPPL